MNSLTVSRRAPLYEISEKLGGVFTLDPNMILELNADYMLDYQSNCCDVVQAYCSMLDLHTVTLTTYLNNLYNDANQWSIRRLLTEMALYCFKDSGGVEFEDDYIGLLCPYPPGDFSVNMYYDILPDLALRRFEADEYGYTYKDIFLDSGANNNNDDNKFAHMPDMLKSLCHITYRIKCRYDYGREAIINYNEHI